MSWMCIYCLKQTKMGPTDFTAKDVGDFYPAYAGRLQKVVSSYHIGPYCGSEACIERSLDRLRDWANKLNPTRDEYVAIIAYAVTISDKAQAS